MKIINTILLLLIPVLGMTQTLKIGDELTVVHYNAGWNSAADVEWVNDLTDCSIKKCDIVTDTKAQNEYEIVVVPTIIIFYEGEEVKRFQADISFAIKATKEEVQEKIDEILMDSF
jgi:hypothetical protein|tara:strand:+ start:446 stop:793 length:348 start_codon:yes stop_codon:yes gene_type:complete